MNRKTKLIALCFLYLFLSLFAAVIIILPFITDNSSVEVINSIEEASAEVPTETEAIEEISEEEISEEETTPAIPEDPPEALVKEEPVSEFPIEFINKIKSNVHIRDGASIDGKIIGKIPPGGKGLITDFVNTNWAMVTYNGLEGYSAFRYFLFEKKTDTKADTSESEKSDLPSDTTDTVEEENITDKATIINNCYIRSSTNSHTMENVIDIAKKDTIYPHDIKNDTQDWCCIILSDGRLGFVSRGFTDCP